MPRLWDDSIESHRRLVRDAIMDAAWRLAEERGPFAVTMSQIAQAAGIGRGTLYKYFVDVESILIARHAGHVERHLSELERLRSAPGTPESRLIEMVGAYAMICFHRARHGTTDMSALVHRGPEVAEIERRLHRLFTEVIDEARSVGAARGDISPGELAAYCVFAAQAAGQATEIDQISRLVRVVLGGLGCAHAEGLDLNAAPAHSQPH